MERLTFRDNTGNSRLLGVSYGDGHGLFAGDTVYRIWKVKGREPEISEHIMVDLVYLVQWLPKFGKTVYLTREEAEAALAKEG